MKSTRLEQNTYGTLIVIQQKALRALTRKLCRSKSKASDFGTQAFSHDVGGGFPNFSRSFLSEEPHCRYGIAGAVYSCWGASPLTAVLKITA